MKPILLLTLLGALACGDDDVLTDAGVDSEVPDAEVPDAEVLDARGPDIDAGMDAADPCMPGDTRAVPCPRCGMAPQACSDSGIWMEPGACFEQGVCESGEVEEEVLEMCATRRRLCLSSCEWSLWDDAAPPGECAPGEQRYSADGCGPSEVSTTVCTDECTWGAPGACEYGCGEPGRASGYEEEICIPSGTYLRGQDDLERGLSQPRTEVHVSAFFIDRYPVTLARLQQCVDAGVCIGIPGQTATNAPVQGTNRERAWRFCRWDGGRRLPTNLEWEKAARGPAPRANVYTWDGDAPSCDELGAATCPEPVILLDVADFPSVRSYYGVDLMVFGVLEPVIDSALSDIGVPDEALFTPFTVVEQGLHRGATPFGSDVLISEFELSRITNFFIDSGVPRSSIFGLGPRGIRCVRSAPGHERAWEADLPE